MTSRISCNAHDYFEIVCMRFSHIEVTTKSGEVFKGVARTIKIVDEQEMLQLNTDNQVNNVPLVNIRKLQAIGNKIEQHNFAVEWN